MTSDHASKRASPQSWCCWNHARRYDHGGVVHGCGTSHLPRSRKGSSSINTTLGILVLVVLGIMGVGVGGRLLFFIPNGQVDVATFINNYNNNNNNKNPKSLYRGKQYWKEGVTLAVRTLWETPFARFQIHSLQWKPDGPRIDDWLWFDESDNVNVLIQSKEDEFLVLEQTKYAISGNSYAVLGGLIDVLDDGGGADGAAFQREAPLAAAKRELMEELGMEATVWKSLGSFVAAANRGGGTTHIFLAQHTRRIAGSESDTERNQEGFIAPGELEHQELVKLSKRELLDALMDGKFKEIKWTATVALALLQQTMDKEVIVNG